MGGKRSGPRGAGVGRRAIAAGLVLLAGLACERDPADLPPSLTIGTSTDVTFEEVPPGGEIRAVRGIQGGYHVVLGFRATGLEPDAPIVDFTVVDLDEGRVLDRFAPLALPLDLVDDAYQLRPRIVVLDIPSLDAIHGHRLELSAVAIDRRGARVERAIDATCVAAP